MYLSYSEDTKTAISSLGLIDKELEDILDCQDLSFSAIMGGGMWKRVGKRYHEKEIFIC